MNWFSDPSAQRQFFWSSHAQEICFRQMTKNKKTQPEIWATMKFNWGLCCNSGVSNSATFFAPDLFFPIRKFRRSQEMERGRKNSLFFGLLLERSCLVTSSWAIVPFFCRRCYLENYHHTVITHLKQDELARLKPVSARSRFFMQLHQHQAI